MENSGETKKVVNQALAIMVGETDDSAAWSDSTPLERFGLDSLDWFSLAAELEAQLGATLDVEDVAHLVTVGDLITVINEKLSRGPNLSKAA